MVPFHEEFLHEFVAILEIGDFSVVLYPELRFECILEPYLNVLFLPLLVVLVANISECKNGCDLPVFMDLLVFHAVEVSLHLTFKDPRKNVVDDQGALYSALTPKHVFLISDFPFINPMGLIVLGLKAP